MLWLWEHIWEDLLLYIALLWVYYTYGRMFRKNTITQSEYFLVRWASLAFFILITLDVLRRFIWPQA